MQKKACGGLWFFYNDSIKKQVEEAHEAQEENNSCGCKSCDLNKIKRNKISSNVFNLKKYKNSLE
jgi:hypothetical protein